MRKVQSLWKHLSIRVLPITVVVFVIGTGIQLFIAQRLETNILQARLESEGDAYAKNVEEYLDSLTNQVQSIGDNSIVLNGLIDFSGRQNYLPLYLESVGIFGRTDIAVQLVDFSAELVGSNFFGDSLEFAEPDLWQDTVLEQGRQWINIDDSGLFVAQPILNRGLSEGAVLVHLDIDFLADGFNNITQSYGRTISTLNGSILYTPDNLSFAHIDMDSEAVGLANNGSIGISSGDNNSISTDGWLWSSGRKIERYGIRTQLYVDTSQSYSIGGMFLPLIAVSLIVVAFSVWLLLLISVGRLKYMISGLSRAIEQTSTSQNLGSRVDNGDSPFELAQLGNQFNEMMTLLQKTTTSRDEVDSILVSMTEWVVVCDEQFLVTSNNRAAIKNSGIGEPVSSLIDLPSEHQFYDDSHEHYSHEQTIDDLIVFWRKARLVVDGTVKGWVLTGTDITDIRQAQQHMRMLEMAIDSASNGMMIVDVIADSTPIVFVNQSFSDITGFSSDEASGRHYSFLHGAESNAGVKQKLEDGMNNGQSVQVEIISYRKSGEPFWSALSIDPVINEREELTHYLGVIRDISKVVSARKELESAKESAEAAAVAKSEFLATMSHEIRTPMNGVLGMLGLLLNTELNSDQAHKAKIALSSAKSLLVLINDILDFSKIEAGKLELESIDFNLREMIGEFAESVAHQAHAKGLELILDMSGIDVSMVNGDPGRIRQIFNNLVGNAIKFTKQGEIYIELNLVENGDSWEMVGRVIDSGIGIPDDKVSLLFDSFSQVDASTTRKFGGTGLGLVIVRRLCQLMGGDIRVMSELERGSVFEFNINLLHSTQSQLVLPSIDVSKLDILIVDDNRTNLDVLRSQLKLWGAKTTEAMSAAEALTICANRCRNSSTPFFDIAIIDMQMPDMDGAELGRQLKGNVDYQDIKMVMMTSMTFEGDKNLLADIGFSAYFPKPATTDNLFDALNVVAAGGEVLTSAKTIVTSEFLNSLRHEGNNAAQAMIHTDFPANTRVLLVEDNQVNQMVAMGLLERSSLSVECASNGIEALTLLNSASTDLPFSIILMDCQMPEMDGFETTRQIRTGRAGESYNQVPIIAMTANAMQGDKERCIDAGMDDYLAKPVDATKLISKLRRWLISDDVNPVNINSEGQEMTDTEIDRLPVWDHQEALARMVGNQKMLETLVQVYLSGRDDQLLTLRTALVEKDFEVIKELAHTIKGVAANLNAEKLVERAGSVEQGLIHGNVESIETSTSEMLLAEAELAEKFTQFLSGSTGPMKL